MHLFFLVEELVFLMVSEKCCKTPKLTIQIIFYSSVWNVDDILQMLGKVYAT